MKQPAKNRGGISYHPDLTASKAIKLAGTNGARPLYITLAVKYTNIGYCYIVPRLGGVLGCCHNI